MEAENDVKVWNRFAFGELQNRDGFLTCLSYTLYRPRDIIVLLNAAFLRVARAGQGMLGRDDIEMASRQISRDRLSDLVKEYDTVFPGLTLLIRYFEKQPAFRTYGEVVSSLTEAIDSNEYKQGESSDFALLGSGGSAFFALYSVGFIGLEATGSKALSFCHDGSPADLDATKQQQNTCVHPCYWKALNIQSDILEEEVLLRLYDDERQPSSADVVADQRMRLCGQIVASLPKMKEGNDDAQEFENWVLRAVRMLFSGQLANAELHPNKESIQRRDIVATNIAEKGFWKRIREDYESRQVVFEVKNFSRLKLENYRQALSYSGGKYGKFVIVVTRSMQEGLSNTERGWVQEMSTRHSLLVFNLPAPMLARCISKLRKSQRFDYAQNLLQKRLDTFERAYLSLRHGK